MIGKKIMSENPSEELNKIIDTAYKEYLVDKDFEKLRDTLDNILVSLKDLKINENDRHRIVVKILNIYSQFEGGDL